MNPSSFPNEGKLFDVSFLFFLSSVFLPLSIPS